MKTFALRTLGCKVNQYESQALRERLLSMGLTDSCGEVADIYVVNTCSVTRKADRESVELIRKLNFSNPKARIFVTGCSAQNAPGVLKALEGVACVVGNDQKEQLPDFVFAYDKQVPETVLDSLHISGFAGHTRAFLKIQDGCNNGCSYCIIPKLRGASRSRPLEQIIKEAETLVANGYKEIVLCGICAGAYGKDRGMANGLVQAIGELEEIEGLLRIRLSSIEATDVSSEFIDAMKGWKKLCRHLHVPFQSGDDKILRLMNRKTSSGECRDLIAALRASFPDIGITTDIIVGFPGEDEKSFNATVEFLNEVRPSRVHVFPFSPRTNTPAVNLGDTVKPEIKKARVRQVKSLAKEFSLGFSHAHIGKIMDVLVEASPCFQTGLYKGYSSNYIKAFIPQAQPFINQIVKLQAIATYADGVLVRENKESASLDTT